MVKITFVVAEITFKVAVITSSMANITDIYYFCSVWEDFLSDCNHFFSGQDHFVVAEITFESLLINILQWSTTENVRYKKIIPYQFSAETKVFWLFTEKVLKIGNIKGSNTNLKLYFYVEPDTTYFTSPVKAVTVAFHWYQIYWQSSTFDYSFVRYSQFFRAWKRARLFLRLTKNSV